MGFSLMGGQSKTSITNVTTSDVKDQSQVNITVTEVERRASASGSDLSFPRVSGAPLTDVSAQFPSTSGSTGSDTASATASMLPSWALLAGLAVLGFLLLRR